MDPVTQQQTGTTPPTTAPIIIWWAFGGTVPTPPPTQQSISETMPAFSFDESDFSAQTTTAIPAHEQIVDPFAGGITSLQQPSEGTPIPDVIQTQEVPTIVDSVPLDPITQDTNTTTSNSPDFSLPDSNTEEQVPSFDLPVQTNSSESNSTLTPVTQDSILTTESLQEENTTSFDLPQPETTQDIPSFSFDTVEENTVATPTINNNIDTLNPITVLENEQPVSFDLPTQQSESITLSEENKNLPSEYNWQPDSWSEAASVLSTKNKDITSIVDESSNSQPLEARDQQATVETSNNMTEEIAIPSSDINNNYEEISAIQQSSQEITVATNSREENIPSLDQEVQQESSVPMVATTVDENRDNNDHDLTEIFAEFKQAYDNYQSLKPAESISLVWLRTDEEEINYTFTTSSSTIIITKSNNNDTLSFTQTESGIQVSINNNQIAYYWVEEVDSDTTHFLKEKLGKFTMILESEYDKELKKQQEKEGMKKLKEDLRNF